MKKQITLRVNGQTYKIAVEPRQTLIDIIRDELGLTGTKEGCGAGSCGSCTVLVDGKTVSSCLVLAVEMEGKDIVTIEGLSMDGKLHPLQQAFIEEGGFQCGFCAPGMLLTAKAFLDTNPHPTELEVKQAISGNLCRCTGYYQIVKAIMKAAEKY
jgi:aerobic carbon-monoxide dehydrogenase small subunit